MTRSQFCAWLETFAAALGFSAAGVAAAAACGAAAAAGVDSRFPRCFGAILVGGLSRIWAVSVGGHRRGSLGLEDARELALEGHDSFKICQATAGSCGACFCFSHNKIWGSPSSWIMSFGVRSRRRQPSSRFQRAPQQTHAGLSISASSIQIQENPYESGNLVESLSVIPVLDGA